MFALDQLSFLHGSFVGIDHLSASPWAGAEDADSTSVATVELGGSALLRRTRTQRTIGDFETFEVFIADPNSDDLLLYAFDTLGFPADPPARGSWVGMSLELHRTTDRGHSRSRFAPLPDATSGFNWSKDFRLDDQSPWQRVVEGSFTSLPASAVSG